MENFTGKVFSGRKLARKMGFPTLNIDYSGDHEGVFAGMVKVQEQWFRAAIHVGARPTVNDDRRVCEAFLLDFVGDVLPEEVIEVRLMEKVREVMKFDSLEQLKFQIEKDIGVIKNILS